MTWVLEGKQNSCYTKVMKNKTNTNTHEASQTQTPRRAKSMTVNAARFWSTVALCYVAASHSASRIPRAAVLRPADYQSAKQQAESLRYV